MEPGLLCDCAVNTAVLSLREPAQYGETLSSLLLLIEKPIAIYLLTLDIKSIPRGGAPANYHGAPSRSWGPPALGFCQCAASASGEKTGWAGRKQGGGTMGEMFLFNFQS